MRITALHMFRTLIAFTLLIAFASTADADHRRWFVDDADGRIVGLADDPGGYTPDGTTAVFDETIRMANPPGATGDILQQGTWLAGVYTAPSGGGIVVPIDPTTDIGSVQAACDDMIDTFEAAFVYIQDNRVAWQSAARKKAVTGIHYQLVNAARVALNSTRTHATRAKFCDESASWPMGVNGDVIQFVDAMGDDSVTTPTKDWSWVNPTTDARLPVGMAAEGFMSATDIENAPGSATLIGRQWIRNIP